MSEVKFTLPFQSGTAEEISDSKVVIPFENCIVTLELPTMDDWELNFDDITTIDYANIVGELLTFPMIHNRVGLLRAAMESLVKIKKLETEVYEAQLRRYYRVNHTVKTESAVKKPTVQEVEDYIITDPGLQVVKKNLINTEKGFANLESLYWSAKDKSGKLDRLADKLFPHEFEKSIVEGQVNGIMIKMAKFNW